MTNAGLLKLLVGTAGIRAFGAIGSVALIATLSHHNSAEVVGEFGEFLAGTIGLTLLVRFGMDAAIIKTGGRLYGDGNFDELSSLRAFCLRISFISAALFIICGATIAAALGHYLFLGLLMVSMPLAFLLSLMLINGSFLRSIQRPRLASIFDLGITQGATALFIISAITLGLPSNNILNVSSFYCAAIAFTIASAIAFPKYLESSRNVNLRTAHSNFSGSLPAFFTLNVAAFINQWGFIAIAGIQLADREVASLLICYRIAAVLSLIQSVSTAVMASRFAYYLAQKKVKLIQSEYKAATIAASGAGIALFAIIVLISEPLLGLFATAHTEHRFSLCVIALGQVINVMTGTCGAFLVVNGQQEIMRNIVIFSGLLGLILYFTFGSIAGVLGMAIANCIAVSCQNLLAFVASRKAMHKLSNASGNH